MQMSGREYEGEPQRDFSAFFSGFHSAGGLGKSATWWNVASRSQHQLCLLAAAAPKSPSKPDSMSHLVWGKFLTWPLFLEKNVLWEKNHVQRNLFITWRKMVDVGCNIRYPRIIFKIHLTLLMGYPPNSLVRAQTTSNHLNGGLDGSPDFGASLFASRIVGLLPSTFGAFSPAIWSGTLLEFSSIFGWFFM